jgi:Zn-dependent protease with chaperone function
MRSPVLFLAFFLMSGLFFSQKFGDHHVAITPETAPVFTFNKEEYEKKLQEKYKGESQKYVKPYIQEEVFYREKFFSSNHIYTNWPEATEFVRKVFEQSIPKQFNITGVKVFVVRDPFPNAYCAEDGHITVTTGLLAHINSEAELASTLCHEYGHYYSNHIFEGYKNDVKTNVAINSLIIQLLSADRRSSFNKNQERQADTFAVSFFTQNGYDMGEIVKSHETFLKLTKKQKELRAYNKSLFYFSTHPSDEERIATTKTAMNKYRLNGKRFQVIDSLQFTKIKKRAVDETINLLFEELLYPECMEMAYLELLYAPNDEFYRFFVLESLRRQMALDTKFGEYFFVTNLYKSPHDWPKKPDFEPVFLSNNEHKSTDFTRSIFNHYNLVYGLNEDDLKNVKAKALVKNDSIEFTTNLETYDYFLHTQDPGSCITNVIKFLNHREADVCSAGLASDELEKEYYKSTVAYRNYSANIDTKDKTAIVAFRLHTTNSADQEYSDKTYLTETYNDFMATASTFNNNCFEAPTKLNFRNKNKLWNILVNKKEFYALGQTFYSPIMGFIPPNTDFLNLFPEFAEEFEKLNYKNILLIELKGTDAPLGNKVWSGSIYCIDIANKKVSKQMYVPTPPGTIDLGGSSTSITGDAKAVTLKILTDCAKLAGIPVKEHVNKQGSYWEKKKEPNAKEEPKKASYWDKKKDPNEKEEPKKASYWDKKDASQNAEKPKEMYWERKERLKMGK